MSVAPNAGIIDFSTFTPPAGGADGIQGQVPAPLAAEVGYVLTTNGWAPAGGGGSAIAVSDEGTQITAGVTSFNFTGSGVTATAVGNAITVNVPGGGGGGGGTIGLDSVFLLMGA